MESHPDLPRPTAPGSGCPRPSVVEQNHRHQADLRSPRSDLEIVWEEEAAAVILDANGVADQLQAIAQRERDHRAGHVKPASLNGQALADGRIGRDCERRGKAAGRIRLAEPGDVQRRRRNVEGPVPTGPSLGSSATRRSLLPIPPSYRPSHRRNLSWILGLLGTRSSSSRHECCEEPPPWASMAACPSHPPRHPAPS